MSHIENPSTTKSAYFDEELARVRTQIHPLFELQISLLRRRNEHCSPIYTLPLEVLVSIFLLLCTRKRASWEMFSRPTGRVVALSAVSSYWRQVVLQTPRVWDSVALFAERHESKAAAALLQHHFDHAKSLCLSVDLLLRVHNQRSYALQYHQPITNILFAPENAQNITILRIENIPITWLANLPELPRLQTLVLEGLQNEDDTPITLDFHTQPLCRLSLSFGVGQIRWGSINLPSSIRELVISNFIFEVLLVLLRQCPNLTKFVHWDHFAFTNSNLLTTSLTLGHLETLFLPVGGFLDPNSIQNLSLPVLKHLHLDYDYNFSPTPTITFCHRFSETLKSLELGARSEGWEASDVRRLFLHKMEHLETLKLTDWEPSELVMVAQVLTPSDKEFCCHEIKFLPQLKSLVLNVQRCGPWNSEIDEDSDDGSDNDLAELLEPPSQHSDDCTDEVIDLFLTFLEKRRAGERTPFRLDLPESWSSTQELIWSEGLQDRLRQVIKGRCIEILQDGEVLEWLS